MNFGQCEMKRNGEVVGIRCCYVLRLCGNHGSSNNGQQNTCYRLDAYVGRECVEEEKEGGGQEVVERLCKGKERRRKKERKGRSNFNRKDETNTKQEGRRKWWAMSR